MAVLGMVLSAFLAPLGTACLLMAAGFVLLWRAPRNCKKWRQAGAGAACCGLMWMALWAVPATSHWLRAELEGQAGSPDVPHLRPTEVAIVLGGAVSGPWPGSRPYPDLNSAADRLWHAARLHRAGKTRIILLSGGITGSAEVPEALLMRAVLHDLGVPATAILLETRSTNTRENARYSAALLRERGVQEVTLVTSALHMRRARLEFELAGLRVQPAPTDFESLGRPMEARDWLPDAATLSASARAFKEVVGYWRARLQR